jgi:rare lipoprotein A
MRLKLTIALLVFIGIVAFKTQNAQGQKVEAKKGVASFYHNKFNGRKTATGEVFKNTKYTAACNKLKLNTYVKVTNTANGNVVYVRINDRMAANNKRLIDLASVAAEKLDFKDEGLAHVKLEIVSEEEGQNGILAQNSTEAAQKNQL